MEHSGRILVNKNNNTILIQSVDIADDFFQRFKGLMFKKEINEDYALILIPCNSIHTFFMNFNIDAIFVDKNKMVVGIYTNLCSGNIIRPLRDCKYVIEMKAQNISSKIKIGDKVNW